ncbi:MAG: Dps family protein [Acholeplasmataceae bacterium]
MNKLYQELNKQVANLSVLFTKLHHFHWYVSGPNFYALHAKFEELYDEVNELYDAVAERLLMIGGEPVSNLKQYLELSTLQEGSGKEDANTMVKHILGDFKVLRAEFLEALKVAQDLGDEATADLLIGSISSFDKHTWMLSATIA